MKVVSLIELAEAPGSYGLAVGCLLRLPQELGVIGM